MPKKHDSDYRDAIFRELGSRIRHARLERNIRQGDLASRLGVTRELLSHIENGRCGCTLINLIQIAKELKVEPCIFLYRKRGEFERSVFGIDWRE